MPASRAFATLVRSWQSLLFMILTLTRLWSCFAEHQFLEILLKDLWSSVNLGSQSPPQDQVVAPSTFSTKRLRPSKCSASRERHFHNLCPLSKPKELITVGVVEPKRTTAASSASRWEAQKEVHVAQTSAQKRTCKRAQSCARSSRTTTRCWNKVKAG